MPKTVELDDKDCPVSATNLGIPTRTDAEIMNWLEENVYHYHDDGEIVSLQFKSGCKNSKPERWLRKQISVVIEKERPKDE